MRMSFHSLLTTGFANFSRTPKHLYFKTPGAKLKQKHFPI